MTEEGIRYYEERLEEVYSRINIKDSNIDTIR